MKKLTAFAIAAGLTLSTAVFAQDKMQDASKKKTAMKSDKMKDHKMSDGKMKEHKMSDGKMKDDKMKPNQ